MRIHVIAHRAAAVGPHANLAAIAVRGGQIEGRLGGNLDHDGKVVAVNEIKAPK